MFGSDFQSGNYEITMNSEVESEVDTLEQTVSWEELAPYVVEDTESRAASSLHIIDYKVVYSSVPDVKSSVTITTKKDGYTYKGTLYFTHSEMDGSKCIAYYSGTLYRQ